MEELKGSSIKGGAENSGVFQLNIYVLYYLRKWRLFHVGDPVLKGRTCKKHQNRIDHTWTWSIRLILTAWTQEGSTSALIYVKNVFKKELQKQNIQNVELDLKTTVKNQFYFRVLRVVALPGRAGPGRA